MEENTEQIKKERDQMRAAFSSMSEGLLAVDKERNITLMNQAAGVLLRVSPETAFGKKVENVFRIFKKENDDSTEEVTGRLMADLFTQPNIINIKLADNFYCKTESGGFFPVSVVMNSLYGEGQSGGIIIFRDISKEKDVDQAKSEFVSLASHQLQTPLASINWYTEMLLSEDVGRLKDVRKKYLNQIYSSSKRMVELVNSLLYISRIELGHLSIDPEPVDVNEIINSIVSEMQIQTNEKKIKIKKEVAENLPKINLDTRLAHVAFQNLLSNAVKYSDEKGEIIIKIENNPPHVIVEINDNGCGIPKDEQYKIFSKLFRAENAREKSPDGNGLGLYIVKEVLEQAGCKIWFKSDGEGKGASFFVSIPAGGMIKRSGSKKLT